ncbi:potassium transporter TrkG [Pectobacterium versatile]|uniref:Prepilin peptidase n=2 Tax=Pectobacterium TaxID=122277 RepID=A0AAW3T0M6_9GAMM|nr:MULTISPECIES: prepilin peptidase [Pectobacterium]MBA5206040.1 prepilin peptidase [Pectobacterium aroidearum]MBN3180233.1 prepilin peptidase [Pectobacterium parmentieri]MBQ4791675.1 potassium transporter TrkG [Pectobacterium versatile]QHQ23447.1 potassium transporter TrkG [Pectobacterium parvum]QRN28974.1 prepilin peptidase [Pectobacterium parmentieri]
MSLFILAPLLFVVLTMVAWLACQHVRWIERFLALQPARVLNGMTLLLLVIPFWLASLVSLYVHESGSLLLLVMQAGLLACAVADVEREWLPESYTVPLFFLALNYSPLPTYIIQPVMVMSAVVVVAALIAVIVRPSLSALLPGRGDIMLWLVLSAWTGIAGSVILFMSLIAGALTMQLTARDHTPLGPWMAGCGALMIPFTTDIQRLADRFMFTLWH